MSNKDADESELVEKTTIILPDVEEDLEPENTDGRLEEQPESEDSVSHHRESSQEPITELGLSKTPGRQHTLESAGGDLSSSSPNMTSYKETMSSSCRMGTCNCKVEISNRHLNDIQTLFRNRADPTGFYLKLMDVAFTKDEMASSNLSGLPRKFKGVLMTKNKLCEKRIRAIGICTQRVFPTQWPLIKDTVKFKDHVNGKCRARNRRKSLGNHGNLAHSSG